MQDFLIFWRSLGDILCDFLMTEPISWFVGIIVLLAIVALVKRIISI